MPVADQPAGSRVLVAVLTYRRPECLARILPVLVGQAARITPPATVLVVDNDPDGGAAAGVRQWSDSNVCYAHEPRPGIAAARNRALDEAADFAAVVFIDDDEVPRDGWLAALVASWDAWGCAGVAGPVIAQFDREVDPWIAASGAFDRRVHNSGDRVSGAATHNLLLDTQAVQRYGVRFDERLGLTGGEDTMFSHLLIHRGGVIRWCDEAEVTEPVAQERLCRRWVVRRAYRAGTSWSRMELELIHSRGRRLVGRIGLGARGVPKFALGLILLATGVLMGDVARQAQGTVMAASYAGLLAGAMGLSLREYRRD